MFNLHVYMYIFITNSTYYIILPFPVHFSMAGDITDIILGGAIMSIFSFIVCFSMIPLGPIYVFQQKIQKHTHTHTILLSFD